MDRFILGTRGSALALAQAELTEHALATAFPQLAVERRVFVTRGDRKLDLSLLRAGEAGGKGLFTKELEDALLSGAIDVAVHSLKDLPGHNPEGLQITAVLERAATADVLICKQPGGFEALPQGAIIGTSSVRRARQIQWLRPDLAVEEWRGNVQTRLRKLAERGDITGIILAQAGLERLGYDLGEGVLVFEEHRFHVESLGPRLLPAIGQGAIALQSRADREDITKLLRALNHEPTFTCVRAERELQRLLSGDCSLPVGVRASLDGSRLHLRGILFGPLGDAPISAVVDGDAAQPEAVAQELFRSLSAGN
jgi:hydroxymethylbilane synthase